MNRSIYTEPDTCPQCGVQDLTREFHFDNTNQRKVEEMAPGRRWIKAIKITEYCKCGYHDRRK